MEIVLVSPKKELETIRTSRPCCETAKQMTPIKQNLVSIEKDLFYLMWVQYSDSVVYWSKITINLMPTSTLYHFQQRANRDNGSYKRKNNTIIQYTT